MSQPKFENQFQAYNWIQQNIQIGQSIEIVLDYASYQKVYYLSCWQSQNVNIQAVRYGSGCYKISLLNEMELPKRLESKQLAPKAPKESPYFDADSFYYSNRNDVKRNDSPIIATVSIPK
jgi:hypothetical protein